MILEIPTIASTAATPDEEMLRLDRAVRGENDAKQRAMFRVQLARCLHDLGDWQGGTTQLELADQESPNNPYVERGLGLARFRDGHIAEGMRLYDNGRWQLPAFDKFARPYPFPAWNGENLIGKTILLWAEQGVGDQVMHARVLHDLTNMGAQIVVECEPRLIPLMKRRFPNIEFHTQTVPLIPALYSHQFDFQTSMFSAWRHVAEPGKNHPALQPSASLVQSFQHSWRNRDAAGRKALNVGLSWSSRAKATGTRRSVSLPMLQVLHQIANGRVRFHNLQYGETDSTTLAQSFGAPLLCDADTDPLKNLDRQCAQISALDLVITIDNATAHLAGALNVPCWIMLPRGSEFRWGKGPRRTNLYGSVKLYRSAYNDTFAPVIRTMADDLERYLALRADIV